MDRQLIMLTGSSPGGGKSTISEFLHEQFVRNGFAARWIYEEDIKALDVFDPVIQAFEEAAGDPIVELLAAAKRIAYELSGPGETLIMDSLFPGFTWLYAANISEVHVINYSKELAVILNSLRPVIVYLDGPIADSLQRAENQRGSAWIEELVDSVRSYEIAKKHPVRTMDDVVAFFESARSLAHRLFTAWPHKVIIIDSGSMRLDEIKHRLCQEFGLKQIESPEKSDDNALQPFVGVYEASVGEEAQKQLVVRLVDGALHVNAQWPNGCALIQETPTRFRLKSTNWIIEFDAHSQQNPRQLTSSVGGQKIVYDRREPT